MSANNLKQAVTSATSSVITLGSAVTDFNAFTAVDDGIEQTYWVFEGNDFQICTGAYTHSGTTLAITNILQKSVSGVVSDLPVTGLTLTSAAVVLIGGHGFNQTQVYQEGVYSTNYFMPHNLNYGQANGKAGGEFGSLAGRLVLMTAIFLYPVKISEIGLYITTASAGGNARVGLYHCNKDGSVGDLIVDSGDIATDATGLTVNSVTPLILPSGRYYMADMGDNVTVTSWGVRSNAASSALFGSAQGTETTDASNVYETKNYYNLTYGALPATLGTPDGNTLWATLSGVFR